MIIYILIAFCSFIFGFFDKAIGFSVGGYSIFIGVIVYLFSIIYLKNKTIVTISGFLYFLAMSSSTNTVGLFSLFLIFLEILYFASQKITVGMSKVIFAICSGIYAGLVYFITLMFLTNFTFEFTGNFVIITLCYAIIGIIISLITKHHLYER